MSASARKLRKEKQLKIKQSVYYNPSSMLSKKLSMQKKRLLLSRAAGDAIASVMAELQMLKSSEKTVISNCVFALIPQSMFPTLTQ